MASYKDTHKAAKSMFDGTELALVEFDRSTK